MTTRAELRRSIGLRARQPFFTRLGTTAKSATGGSTLTLIDTVNLLQPDSFWIDQHLYLPATDVSRVISAFVSGTKTATFLEAITAITAGTAYEIWSQFSAPSVNEAINQSLRDAWPFFFTHNEGRIVIQDHIGVTYALASLIPAPKWIAQVLVENPPSSRTGQCTSTGTNLQIINTNEAFTTADVGKEIRIFDGTSSGDIRTISSITSPTIAVPSVAFTSALTATSKYRLVDIIHTIEQYSPTWRWGTDKEENPTNLRLSSHPSGYAGYLMRVLYEAEYPPMSLEADVLTAPQEYVELATLARLFLGIISDAPRSELDSWTALQKAYVDAAQSYAQKNKFRHFSGAVHDDTGQHSLPADYPF